jgi:hypothetical protein
MPKASCSSTKGGFLSATSVGFSPLKYAFTDDPKRRFGIDFLEQELLEFSCVTVPANAEALIEGRAAGIDVTPMLDWCEQQMKRAADKARVQKLAETVLGSKGDDPVLLAWAERIVGISTDRLTAIKALAEEFRSDAKKAVGSKGASGIYRRCANRVEKAIVGDGEAEQQPDQPEASGNQDEPVNVVAGFAEIAARRLTMVRHKTA